MASETSNTCSVVLDSSPTAGAKVCQDILARLDEEGYNKDDAFAVHLAFEEAFANAVKHGNKLDPQKKVTVSYTVDNHKVVISITDEGPGFDPSGVPDCRCGKNLFKPNGRGVLLIHSYMDMVGYSDQGRTVQMTRYRERPPVGEGRQADL
jgi:serine/threonine-protein kinase RsbW